MEKEREKSGRALEIEKTRKNYRSSMLERVLEIDT